MPVRLEVAGPPGSGKTTIAKGLEDRDPRFRPICPPDWKNPRALPFYVKNGLVLMPLFAALSRGRGRRRPNVHEFVWLTLLNGWDRRLGRPSVGPGLAIIDQGPVYMMSMLIVHREGELGRPRMSAWLDRAARRWARALDAVVLLDAPDEVLARRINTRPDDHIQKGSPDARVRDFLKVRRAALDRATGLLRSQNDALTVLRFDTERQAPGEILDKILAALSPPE